jgi:hypothetical protein
MVLLVLLRGGKGSSDISLVNESELKISFLELSKKHQDIELDQRMYQETKHCSLRNIKTINSTKEFNQEIDQRSFSWNRKV